MPRDRPYRLDFLLGLPSLADNLLWKTARRLQAPVLISANALSRWRTDSHGARCWVGFDTRNSHLVHDHPVWLDSAGFVAITRYKYFPWSTDDYLDLCASAPWRGFFSADLCVEPEIAHDRETILDRISATVRLNTLCRQGSENRGIADRYCPVLQGWHPHDYLRCLDRMLFALDYPLVGIGSMCRRPVNGDHGILRVLDELDAAFTDAQTRVHLFGLKSQGMEAVRGHPRVASVDSRAGALPDVSKPGRHAAAKPMRSWPTP